MGHKSSKVAKPPPATQPPPPVTQPIAPLTRAEIETAIQSYAPIFQLHPSEKYFPCSIEWFLTHATLVDSQPNPDTTILHPSEFQLPQAPKDGTRYFLNIEDAVKPGNLESAKSYVNCFWKSGMSWTDLQFWVFSAYNGHATAKFDSLVANKVKHTGKIDLSPLGEHVGDWEYAAIRIDNTSKTLLGVVLSAHGKNTFYGFSKPEIRKQFTFTGEKGRPTVYSSLNGHANFPGIGDNYTERRKILGIPIGLEFNLLNTTSASGASLDCAQKYQVVAAKWLEGTSDAYEIPPWVGYPYRWGPEGTVITMDSRTLGEFIKAALGEDAGDPLLDTPIIILASELLHVFVKADINGAGAPAGQNPWIGNY